MSSSARVGVMCVLDFIMKEGTSEGLVKHLILFMDIIVDLSR